MQNKCRFSLEKDHYGSVEDHCASVGLIGGQWDTVGVNENQQGSVGLIRVIMGQWGIIKCGPVKVIGVQWSSVGLSRG